uniref:Uncharacterized protein n=1 Tax=virus sp. ctML55 TaxID=2827627 RepID=A0A8S5RIA0_9VIRU|nr:MAG TPA: hypothetical protein [virus sp. ctML55]
MSIFKTTQNNLRLNSLKRILLYSLGFTPL